jgi:hypothetical protein
MRITLKPPHITTSFSSKLLSISSDTLAIHSVTSTKHPQLTLFTSLGYDPDFVLDLHSATTTDIVNIKQLSKESTELFFIKKSSKFFHVISPKKRNLI